MERLTANLFVADDDVSDNEDYIQETVENNDVKVGKIVREESHNDNANNDAAMLAELLTAQKKYKSGAISKETYDRLVKIIKGNYGRK